ncbi:LysR family transcriptional regulator [Phaeobacter gallaeciensis]|uniref:LysR family transcriptional regulator n=1 Tax=Phaeobacter gallaeciensis TaxID=60890 RepID=UPI00237F9E33|nr:LysR family transcriptional regulator [Phaeobacter gallaeciensis]MDE4142609.1 LysR family transcriptional regulator [Phaeobacter gallaeciensis]MDE4151054.1 LysR family transcriptional regulator [Phaeobacter gallaeciensis]MDE4155283.1 LysR family transcriptional regulator [Phaeobacter gallaeciensis]MDE4230673.1 LysR family transcriptional regulator [Phaeobacter gallaeciensis]MDE4259750.1 LysR family transcriptional regulator [Phaeobacter gallaeciensis]
MKSEFRNWSGIRIFLAVVRAGSTLAAARQLGMAQPTVARRIEALEHELGVTLFERDTRGFHPTEMARALLPKAEEIEAATTRFAQTIEALTSTRPIRITAYSGNFSPRVATIFSEFSVLRPDVSFEFLPSVEVLDLAAGEADIALRLTRNLPDPELICRKISTARYALYGSRTYAEKHGLPVSTEDLVNHAFVSFLREGVPSAFHDWLIRHVEPDQIRQTYSEIDLMHAAIRSGHGLGIMNVKLVESDDTLIQCFAPLEEMNSEHLMLIAPEAYRRPEVKAFTKFFAPRYTAVFRSPAPTALG